MSSLADSDSSNSPRAWPLWWGVATVIAATIMAALVAQLTIRQQDDSHHHDHDHGDASGFHEWLHANLALTPEQEAVLRPHEEAYEAAREEQRMEIWSAGHELANAIREHEGHSPEVAAAQERLLAAQGELQRLTLEHFFAMKEGLTPEQGERLLQWTHDSIVHGHEY